MCLRVRVLRVEVVYAHVIQGERILVRADSWNSFALGSAPIVRDGSVGNLTFQLEGFGTDAERMLWVVGAGAWRDGIRLVDLLIVS